jgi:serine/threonine protein kinase
MHPSDVVRKYVRPGTTLGDRYEVEDFIGSGAYGSIFTAIDTVTMERVAVKALPPADEGVNETALGRFHREMKVVSTLRHPNVITMYDFGETEDRIVYMVLEFVDGPTLHDYVSANRFSPSQGLDVTKQIARGLRAAHELGVIHRDLKPQNIMLIEQPNGQYRVKVLDFGMAKLLTRINDESIIQLTREGVAVGTPRYIAPEQARGKKVGPYSDLYALGLLMYEMFTGERAVKADSIETAIIAHVSREPLQLDEIDDVPDSVRPILLKLIEKSVRKRYQDADEAIADIEKLEQKIRHAHVRENTPPKPSAPELNSSAEKDDPGRLRSIHSADNLELDYDRFDEYAPKKKPKKKKRKRSGVPLLRLPLSRVEWFESALAILVAFPAFLFLSAHLHGSGYGIRLLVGAMPTLIAGLASLVMQSSEWRWSFFRLWLVTNIVAFVGANLFLQSLAIGLMSSPAWFLDPFAGAPGVSAARSLVTGIARTHVGMLLHLDADLAPIVRSIATNAATR